MRTIDVSKSARPETVAPGPAPMLDWLSIDSLIVDETYQRDLKRGNWTAIRRIAENFTWSRFSPVFVAPIEGGQYAIIDGQHRTHAAALCGIEKVPCQIVHMSREEQAASFAAVNGTVTAVTIWQLFKAALAANEDWAVECHNVCARAGVVLRTSNASADEKRPGEIYAVGLIRKLVADGRGEMVSVALEALRQSECGTLVDAWTGPTLKPLLEALAPRIYLKGRIDELAGAFDAIDILSVLDDAERDAKEARRLGKVGVSRTTLAEARIAIAIDERLGPLAQGANP